MTRRTLMFALALAACALAQPTGYIKCASEGGTCVFSGTAQVIFGAGTMFTAPKSFTGGVACNTGIFTDPDYGVVKSCYYLPTVTPPPTPTPTPSPTPAPSPPPTSLIWLVVDPSVVATASGNIDLSGANSVNLGGYLSIVVPNEGVTGTTVNRLASFTGSPQSTAIIAGAGPVIGVVVSGAGTTGNARIALRGFAPCDFDGATTAGDYVQAGTGGQCHDAGAVRPTGGQVLGYVLSSNAVAGTYTMLLGE